jgi:hypothetical protein
MCFKELGSMARLDVSTRFDEDSFLYQYFRDKVIDEVSPPAIENLLTKTLTEEVWNFEKLRALSEANILC